MLPIDPIKVKNAATGPTTVCASTARKPGSPLAAGADKQRLEKRLRHERGDDTGHREART